MIEIFQQTGAALLYTAMVVVLLVMAIYFGITIGALIDYLALTLPGLIERVGTVITIATYRGG